jgi:hypothetical protein
MQNKSLKIILIGIFSLVLVFHFLVLTGLIPYEVAWGGRLKSKDEMIVFETASILLNGLFLLVVLIKAHYLKINLPNAFLNGTLWVMVVLFAVNTVGNLLAINPWEKFIATPITLILSILSYQIAREK